MSRGGNAVKYAEEYSSESEISNQTHDPMVGHGGADEHGRGSLLVKGMEIRVDHVAESAEWMIGLARIEIARYPTRQRVHADFVVAEDGAIVRQGIHELAVSAVQSIIAPAHGGRRAGLGNELCKAGPAQNSIACARQNPEFRADSEESNDNRQRRGPQAQEFP